MVENGKHDVLLSLPTGAGKTMAYLAHPARRLHRDSNPRVRMAAILLLSGGEGSAEKAATGEHRSGGAQGIGQTMCDLNGRVFGEDDVSS